MCSDPNVRAEVLRTLDAMGGVVYGRSHGAVARQLRPQGATVTAAKAAVNSLARSISRPPRVVISRPDGLVKLAIIRP